MKIVTVSDTFPNREHPVLGTFCLDRVKALSKIADIRVVAPVPYWPDWPLLRPLQKYSAFARVGVNDVIDGIQVYHPRRVVIPKIGNYTSAVFYRMSLMRALVKLREEFDFDVIDAHFLWPAGYAAVEVGKALGVPVIVTAHGFDVTLAPKYWTIRSFVRKTLERANRIVAVSQALADTMTEDLDLPRNRVQVIPNGVDLAKFRRVDPVPARKMLGIDADARALLSIGALIPRKGHEFLIDAIAILVHREGMHDLKLNIIGDGPSRTALQKRIESHSLAEHVRLVGPVPHDELYRWISASDYLCLASSREGWPTVFFESWACGVPVIATAVQGTPEAICSDSYGLLVAQQDAELFAKAIQRATSMQFDPEQLIAYAARHTWDELQRLHFEQIEVIVAAQRGSNSVRKGPVPSPENSRR